ncbi:hypothetical protein FDP41_003238 [Naegleria fowleri]|uniref:Gamma-glutamylcyclotransferase AIG2-like domain-containing protein n=1 Tax=Naegleria fowleri TaxID=5763 RepID=A0A6A5BRX9_NAEFO|nr:uncharacterized protein FDP41_003238 [Naegleria fowleri]KAF0977916.1 hypothetical protein FDP41_003238 [Naegleria fowleri]CAG4717064.1 unnamed protein product [Naegleria fowleri]
MFHQAISKMFVYGTLRPDDTSGAPWTHPFNNPQGYQVHAQFGYIEKAQLFFHKYPIAILNDNPNDRIYGYIISVSEPEGENFEKLLKFADEIEEYPEEYDRAIVEAYPISKTEYDDNNMQQTVHKPPIQSQSPPIPCFVYHRTLQNIAIRDSNPQLQPIPSGDWLLRK